MRTNSAGEYSEENTIFGTLYDGSAQVTLMNNADINAMPDIDAISDEAAGRVPHLRTADPRSHPLRPAVVPYF